MKNLKGAAVKERKAMQTSEFELFSGHFGSPEWLWLTLQHYKDKTGARYELHDPGRIPIDNCSIPVQKLKRED